MGKDERVKGERGRSEIGREKEEKGRRGKERKKRRGKQRSLFIYDGGKGRRGK